MKKEKYSNISVIMACLSGKKSKTELQNIDELRNKYCAGCNKENNKCSVIHREALLAKKHS